MPIKSISIIIYAAFAICIFISFLCINYRHHKNYGEPIGNSKRADFWWAFGMAALWPMSCYAALFYVALRLACVI